MLHLPFKIIDFIIAIVLKKIYNLLRKMFFITL